MCNTLRRVNFCYNSLGPQAQQSLCVWDAPAAFYSFYSRWMREAGTGVLKKQWTLSCFGQKSLERCLNAFSVSVAVT